MAVVKASLWRLLILSGLLWLPVMAMPAAAMQPELTCETETTPQFGDVFAPLKTELGDLMGDPVDCEHVESTTGLAYQQTTTGVALHDPARQTTVFSNGIQRWILTPAGVVPSDLSDHAVPIPPEWAPLSSRFQPPPPPVPWPAGPPHPPVTPQPKTGPLGIPTIGPTPTPTPPPERSITVSGNAATNTVPFELRGGNYLVTWTATLQPDHSRCEVGGWLIRLDNQSQMQLVMDAHLDNRRQILAIGETRLEGLRPGHHYFGVGGRRCDWAITIAPR